MCKFLRLVDDSIVNLFVRKVKDVSECYHHFENRPPDSFCDCEFHSPRACFPEQCADGLVRIEPLDYGKQIVLYCGQRGACNLGCEIPRLALAESKKGLAVLEDDFQSPPLGINPVCIEEVKRHVRGYESVPGTLFAASDKEETDLRARKDDIGRGIVAFELAAVLDLLSCLKQFDKRRCGKVFAFKPVFGASFLSNLDHSKIIAAYVAAADETYDLGASEPAVGQDVAETYTLPYGALDHVNGKFNLAEAVFSDAFLNGRISGTGLAVSGIEFPVFIDSPLQKFDKSHSSKIITEFYPSISKQVVLFPLLHKELTEDELDIMKPLVKSAYLIKNEVDHSYFKQVPVDKLMND